MVVRSGRSFGICHFFRASELSVRCIPATFTGPLPGLYNSTQSKDIAAKSNDLVPCFRPAGGWRYSLAIQLCPGRWRFLRGPKPQRQIDRQAKRVVPCGSNRDADGIGIVARFNQENPRWGYTRIRDYLVSLGHKIGETTIKNILLESGYDPDSQDRLQCRTASEFRYA
jgi:hypothetical protein